ncbi:MAG: UxaA family hydrolase, partial [Pseudomonadota bacterium]
PAGSHAASNACNAPCFDLNVLNMSVESQVFMGFRRASGRAGVRNLTLVLSATGLTGPTARRIAAQVRGTVCVCTPTDTGPLGYDREVTERALRGFVAHPNVGAVLIVGGNAPKVQALQSHAEQCGRLALGISLDSCGHDALALTDRGVRAAAGFVRVLSRAQREPVTVSELFLGLECGRSDPSSGLGANPLVGDLADRLVDAGGAVSIGETTEWMGAEHLLAARARSSTVADEIEQATARREQFAREAGIDLLGNNPGPTNIAAGLSTIEEKSLGNIAKSGTRTIQGVLSYGESPASSGVYLMDAAAYAPESLTGFTIAGAQLQLFTTGVGNSFVNLLAPTVKLSANPHTVARLAEQLDFDASEALTGAAAREEVAGRLWDTVVEIASGALTWGEVLGEGEEVISRYGAAL